MRLVLLLLVIACLLSPCQLSPCLAQMRPTFQDRCAAAHARKEKPISDAVYAMCIAAGPRDAREACESAAQIVVPAPAKGAHVDLPYRLDSTMTLDKMVVEGWTATIANSGKCMHFLGAGGATINGMQEQIVYPREVVEVRKAGAGFTVTVAGQLTQ